MSNMAKTCFLIICTGLLSCSTSESVMAPYESALALNSSNAKNFHTMMYFPSGTTLHYPGYVIGIEKSSQSIVGGPKRYPEIAFVKNGHYINREKPSAWDTANQINRFQRNDWKAMFISHIIKNSTAKNMASPAKPYFYRDHCFVYNAYAAKPLSMIRKDYDLAKISDWHACETATNLDLVDSTTEQLYDFGKQALLSLERNVTADLKTGVYTHVVVIVMGWNTAQEEAIRNFNDLIGNMMAASYESKAGQQDNPINRTIATAPKGPENGAFRPLVIGVTWPSYWSNSLGNIFSYSNKAGDADEIGLSWLNKIFNEMIPNSLSASSSHAKVVAIGHSFGARAMTRALFSSPALVPLGAKFPDQDMVTSPVHLAVALQGAMSIERLAPGESNEGAPYRDFAELQNTKLVLTASKYDDATGANFIFWTKPAGAASSYADACSTPTPEYKRIFNCFEASDESATTGGSFSVCPYGSKDCDDALQAARGNKKVDYIDTSNGVTEFNSPGSGGGAHSDIYRLPMGRLLWKLIEAYASEP
jgi:hypothetical protein